MSADHQMDPHDDLLRDPETGLEIAVVGLAGRFPGASSVADLWRLLRAGEEGLTRFSREQLEQAGVPADVLDREDYVPVRGVLEEADTFDAELFGYGPREAEIMDPQQRVFLECAFHALEDAGYDPARAEFPIGLWGSCGLSSYIGRFYADPRLVERFGVHALALANDKDFLCTRVAYKLDLGGPAVTVQTACSSSLVAVHMACQGLLAGECDLALAGGVSVSFPQQRGYLYAPGGIVSPDGRTRTFDADAAGAVSGHGVALVVLKRLEDALADGDEVRAVIRGSALANDGARRAGFTAPSQEGQARALRAAYQMAQVDPATVTYVEAHGTATELGDPIEVSALRQAFEAESEALGKEAVTVQGQPAPCWLGSVKTNLGHLDAAAGVAGLIKAVLALQHGELPPSLHFESPNPRLPFDGSRFRVAAQLQPWERPRRGGATLPLRAAVSSFGLGGTNAHVILEEAPAPVEPVPEESVDRLLVVSAGDGEARDQLAADLADHLANHLEADPAAQQAAHQEVGEGLSLRDVAATLSQGRRAQSHRLAVVASTPEEAIARLRGEEPQERLVGVPGDAPPVVLLLPGVGDHYAGLGRELYRREPVFRQVVDRCAEVLQREVGEDPRRWLDSGEEASGAGAAPDLRAMLRRGPAAEDSSSPSLSPLAAQLLVFTVEQALVALWRSWGVRPAAVVGYSLGEISAACASGALELEDAALFVARRARLMEALPAGVLLAVPLGVEELEPHLRQLAAETESSGTDANSSADPNAGVHLLADNASSSCVVAGREEAIAALESKLEAAGVAYRRVGSDRPVHTPLANTTVAELERFAPALAAPRIPWASTVSGELVAGARDAAGIDHTGAAAASHWGRQWTSPVRYRRALTAAVESVRRGRPADSPVLLLEAGPGQALGSFALASQSGVTALPSLPFAYDRQPARRFALRTLGRLWTAGVAVRWTALDGSGPDGSGSDGEELPRRVPLPLTPLRRQRYWIDGESDGAALPPSAEGSWERIEDPAARFLVPVWSPAPVWVSNSRQASGEALAEGNTLVLPLEARGDASLRAGELAQALGARAEVASSWTPDSASGCREEWRAALQQLLATATESARPLVVLLTSSPGSLPQEDPSAALESIRRGPLAALFAFAELWAGSTPRPCDLVVLLPGNSGTQSARAPERALLVGAARSLAQEGPGLELRLIDPGTPEDPADWARRVQQGLTAPSEQRFVVHADGQRLHRRWEKLLLPESSGLPASGVHWISGGLGGLGIALGRHLAKRAAADGQRLILVLASRGGLEVQGGEGQRRRAAVDELTSLGAEVRVQTVNVVQREALAQALTEAAQWGPLTAIYHLAARPGGGLMALRTAAEVDEVLDAKAGAAALLWELVPELPQPPQAVVLFSSTAAAAGGLGQGDYAAANRYLGALAASASSASRSSAAGTRWLAVDWDEWQWDAWGAGREGLPAELVATLDAQRRTYGLREEEGFGALDRALGALLEGAPISRLLVSTRDLRPWLASAGPRLADLSVVPGGSGEPGERPRHERPQLAVEYVAPRSADEEALARLWEDLLGVAPVGIHDSFLDLGGHSLLALQLISRLREETGRAVELREVFEYPTVEALAARLKQLSTAAVGEDESILPVADEIVAAESHSADSAVPSEEEIAALSAEDLDLLLGELGAEEALAELGVEELGADGLLGEGGLLGEPAQDDETSGGEQG
ncbi:MAG: beta-ketoacyl synthase N-terminal-like domain-containing protein [Acidobacteriota bacterium]